MAVTVCLHCRNILLYGFFVLFHTHMCLCVVGVCACGIDDVCACVEQTDIQSVRESIQLQ